MYLWFLFKKFVMMFDGYYVCYRQILPGCFTGHVYCHDVWYSECSRETSFQLILKRNNYAGLFCADLCPFISVLYSWDIVTRGTENKWSKTEFIVVRHCMLNFLSISVFKSVFIYVKTGSFIALSLYVIKYYIINFCGTQ